MDFLHDLWNHEFMRRALVGGALIGFTNGFLGTFIILLCGALFYARTFFLPLVLAVLVTMTLAPLTRALAHRGVPYPVSAVLLIVALGVAIVVATTLVSPTEVRAEVPSARLTNGTELRVRVENTGPEGMVLRGAGEIVIGS